MVFRQLRKSLIIAAPLVLVACLCSTPALASAQSKSAQPADARPDSLALRQTASKQILDSLKLEAEISKLKAEVAGLIATNQALGPVSRWGAVWVPFFSAAVAAMVALLLNTTINRAQTARLAQERTFANDRHDIDIETLLQEKQIANERHLLDVAKELGNEAVGVRAAAIATLVQRLRRTRHLLAEASNQPSGVQTHKLLDRTALEEDRRMIVGLLIQASKHEEDEAAQKYIGDGIGEALGALDASDGKARSPLSEHDFQGVRFTNVWWKGIDARGVDFYGATLKRAGLRDAKLQGAILKNANLRGATLIGAHLDKADLSGADLHGVRADSLDLTGTKVFGMRINASALNGMRLTADQRKQLVIDS